MCLTSAPISTSREAVQVHTRLIYTLPLYSIAPLPFYHPSAPASRFLPQFIFSVITPYIHIYSPTCSIGRLEHFTLYLHRAQRPFEPGMSEYLTLPTISTALVLLTASLFIMPEFREMAKVTLFGSGNKGGASFNPSKDIPSLAGKVVLITGAAGDLGRQTAIELAKYGRPARLYVADLPRDEAAKKEIVERIGREAYREGDVVAGADAKGPETEVRFVDLDLTSLESVKVCAAEVLAKEERLDVLFLNAGIIRVAKGTTKEGYEVHFGLNYLGHALLAKLLTPLLVKTAKQTGSEARFVVVSSEGHAMAPKGGIQFDKLKTECAAMVRYSNPCNPHKHGLTFLGLLPTIRPKQTSSHPPCPTTCQTSPRV